MAQLATPRTTRPAASHPSADRRQEQVIAAGSVLAAVAATSCCILPLTLFSLGAGGVWIGRLTSLAPFQPVFAAIAAGLLGCGYWLVYRRRRQAACEDGAACARALPSRLVEGALWSATLLVFAALAFPYVIPFIL